MQHLIYKKPNKEDLGNKLSNFHLLRLRYDICLKNMIRIINRVDKKHTESEQFNNATINN